MASKRTARILLPTIALLIVTCGVCVADSYDIKVYPCARASTEIVVDGDLSEAAWEQAPVVNEFTYHNKQEPVDVQTHFRVLYTDSELLLGLRFDEPNMDQMTPIGQSRDSMGVFRGEAVEIFVDPDHDQQVYYQIAVNAAASIYDSRKTDPTWSADVRAGVKLLDNAWTLEVAIPWADLGVQPEAGMVVGLNVCRDRHLGPNKTWSNWSQVEANFHDPERFGHIVLSPSASRIGELADEFRKGERTGPIVIYGPESFVHASSRTIAATTIDEGQELLARLEETRQGEADAGARKELDRRIASYRSELNDFEATATGGKLVAPERWRQMNHRIAEMRDELRTIIWQARLSAVISRI